MTGLEVPDPVNAERLLGQGSERDENRRFVGVTGIGVHGLGLVLGSTAHAARLPAVGTAEGARGDGIQETSQDPYLVGIETGSGAPFDCFPQAVRGGFE